MFWGAIIGVGPTVSCAFCTHGVVLNVGGADCYVNFVAGIIGFHAQSPAEGRKTRKFMLHPLCEAF